MRWPIPLGQEPKITKTHVEGKVSHILSTTAIKGITTDGKKLKIIVMVSTCLFCFRDILNNILKHVFFFYLELIVL